MPHAAPFTSERLSVPHYTRTAEGLLVYQIHLTAYQWFAGECQGKRVLDFGCGTGYGSAEIAKAADRVVGVDVSADAIAQARADYAVPALDFSEIPPVERQPLPFADGSFDVVVSNQVIEHVGDPDAYLREARRVLRPEGLLFVVTPDRATRLFPGQRPWNIFHLHEYRPTELAALVERHFTRLALSGMTGEASVVGREIARTRRNRLLTLPFTYGPEAWRQVSLRLVKRLMPDAGGSDRPAEASLPPNAFRITADAHPSINICLRAVRS